MTSPNLSVDSASHDSLGAVLGRVASGVYILTASDGQGRETGMLTSWVQQASFDPPLLSVAVNRERWWIDWLTSSPQVGLSIVGSEQKELLKKYGKGFGPEEAAFEGMNVFRGASGVPLLADALGSLEGRVVDRMSAGDHLLFLVEIEAAHPGPEMETSRPMIHVRKNGFRY